MQLKWGIGDIGGFNFEGIRATSSITTGSASLGECLDTLLRIKDGNHESWIKEWIATAQIVHQEADAALQKHRLATARSAFLRAATYYQCASFLIVTTDSRKFDTWKKSIICFEAACSLFDPKIEVVRIPYLDNAKLPGYFLKGGEGKRPTVMMLGGFDASKEEVVHWLGFAAQKRGWNALVFEGPGQVGAVHLNPGLHMRYDFEVPIKAVVDYLETRNDIDFDRLALVGQSMGGYLAPRAAAFEKRIKAVIASSLQVDTNKVVLASCPPIFPILIKHESLFRLLAKYEPRMHWAADQSMFVFGNLTAQGVFDQFKKFNLWPVVDKLTVPLLAAFGQNEFDSWNKTRFGKAIAEELERFWKALKCDKTLITFDYKSGAALHCHFGGVDIFQNYAMDWLEEKLQVSQPFNP